MGNDYNTWRLCFMSFVFQCRLALIAPENTFPLFFPFLVLSLFSFDGRMNALVYVDIWTRLWTGLLEMVGTGYSTLYFTCGKTMLAGLVFQLYIVHLHWMNAFHLNIWRKTLNILIYNTQKCLTAGEYLICDMFFKEHNFRCPENREIIYC